MEVGRPQVVRQPASEFAAPCLGIEPGEDCWLPESVLLSDGEPIAWLQEDIAALPVRFAGGGAAPLEISVDGGPTLVAALRKAAGRRLGPGECQIGRGAEPRQAT